MTIKQILVPLPGSDTYSVEIDLAMSVAKRMGAHVEALFISQPPSSLRTGVSDSSVSYVRGSVALALQNQSVEQSEQHAREAREQFVRACAANGIPILEASQESDELPSCVALSDAKGKDATDEPRYACGRPRNSKCCYFWRLDFWSAAFFANRSAFNRSVFSRMTSARAS